MSTNSKSDSRLNFRLPSNLKHVIEQAAGYLGQSVSEFAVSTLVRSAQDVIERNDRTELSNLDRERFLTLMNDTDAEPNAALAAAAKKYTQQTD